MSGKLKLPKALREYLDSQGAKVLSVRRNKHIVMRVQAVNGVVATLTTSLTASDQRAIKNFARDFKHATNSPEETSE